MTVLKHFSLEMTQGSVFQGTQKVTISIISEPIGTGHL